MLKPEILYWEERCIQCGACVEACPEKALTWKDGGLDTDRSRCNGCGTCVSVCPAGARELAGRTVTVDNVMHEVEKDTLFYEESGGGITLSGGEPLAQPEFCLALLQRCRSLGIKTALDTSGYAPEETLLAIAEGATPNGRFAGEPLSESRSGHQRTDRGDQVSGEDRSCAHRRDTPESEVPPQAPFR